MGGDGTRKFEPMVLILIPDCLLRHGEIAIGETARRNADQIRKAIWLPPKVRSAFTAEMESDVEPAGRWPAKDLGLAPGDRHVDPMVERRNAEQRARSPLAVETMA